MKLAENLQYFRHKYGLSQEELAEKCYVSRQAIAKWECADSTPGLDKLCFLAEFYNVSFDELVGRKSIDKYARFMELIKDSIVDDIPKDDEDNISPIVSRYLMFMQEIDVSPENSLKGLEKIFLKK